MVDPKTKFSVLNNQGEFEAYSPDKIKSNVPTYFITHGLLGTAAEGQPWQKDMVESLEAQNNGANVIQVSWDSPLVNPTILSLTNYEQAAANTKIVGKNIVGVIKGSGGKIKPGTTTLIGHSLGAQASGWAGDEAQKQKIGNIGTIVGLDPARPSFQNRLISQEGLLGPGLYKSSHELNADDANRVIAIHTSKRFGITKPITGTGDDGNNNTLDIYVKGGSAFNNRQDITGIKSHNYSHDFFQDLLDGKGFDQDRNKRKNSKSLSGLRNPERNGAEQPLISLNTILQGKGEPGDFNRGIVDVKRSENANIPNGLLFEGTSRRDVLAGTKSNDTIKASGNNDITSGLQGNDALFGGTGRDTLYGGAGEDTLTGVNTESVSPGKGEIDILTGGGGSDKFVLGDANKAYYKDFPDSQVDDYAIIKDFNIDDNDRIILGPDTNNYLYLDLDSNDFELQGGNITGGVGIVIERAGGENELIGIVENANPMDVMNRSIVNIAQPEPQMVI